METLCIAQGPLFSALWWPKWEEKSKEELIYIYIFSLSALWWRRIRCLWKLPYGRDWLRWKLGLTVMGGAMLSKSLIQFSVDGRGCVPSLSFDLRPNYGGGNEDNSRTCWGYDIIFEDDRMSHLFMWANVFLRAFQMTQVVKNPLINTGRWKRHRFNP